MHALSQENPRGDCVSFRDHPISELMHTPTHNDTQFSLVGAGGAGGDIFENEPSGAVQDEEKAKRLWELSAKAVGLPYDSSVTDVLPETAAEIAAKNGPKSLPGIPLPNFVPDSRGKLDKRAKEGTSSAILGGRQ
uniref:Uncharacterized protein n=1 Tax=Lotharella globosa TaxID=91324 RepID=A0A7S3YWR4_9EUKA